VAETEETYKDTNYVGETFYQNIVTAVTSLSQHMKWSFMLDTRGSL